MTPKLQTNRENFVIAVSRKAPYNVRLAHIPNSYSESEKRGHAYVRVSSCHQLKFNTDAKPHPLHIVYSTWGKCCIFPPYCAVSLDTQPHHCTWQIQKGVESLAVYCTVVTIWIEVWHSAQFILDTNSMHCVYIHKVCIVCLCSHLCGLFTLARGYPFTCWTAFAPPWRKLCAVQKLGYESNQEEKLLYCFGNALQLMAILNHCWSRIDIVGFQNFSPDLMCRLLIPPSRQQPLMEALCPRVLRLSIVVS